MADPIPFKPGLVPETDDERELIDYFMMKLRKFREGTGALPEGIALVMLGHGKGGEFHSLGFSWSPKEVITRFETCSMASVLLAKRASES